MEYKCKIKMGILLLILFVVFLLKDLGVWGLANIEVGTIFLFLFGVIMLKMACHMKKNGGCCHGNCDTELKQTASKTKKATKKKK